MADVRVDGTDVVVQMSLVDKLLALHGSMRIPLAHIVNAYVSDFEDLQLQYKLTGTNLGFVRAAGVFTNPQGLIFADIGEGNCLVLQTQGERFPLVAIELPKGHDPNALAHEIMARLPDSGPVE